MHASAMGKVLLAFSLEPDRRRGRAHSGALERFTDATRTARDDVVAELERVRHARVRHQHRGTSRRRVRVCRAGQGAQRGRPRGHRRAGPERAADAAAARRTRSRRGRRRRPRSRRSSSASDRIPCAQRAMISAKIASASTSRPRRSNQAHTLATSRWRKSRPWMLAAMSIGLREVDEPDPVVPPEQVVGRQVAVGEPFAGHRSPARRRAGRAPTPVARGRGERPGAAGRPSRSRRCTARSRTSSAYAIGYGTFIPACQSRVMTSYSWPVQRSCSRCLPYVDIRSTARRSRDLRNWRPSRYCTSLRNADERCTPMASS